MTRCETCGLPVAIFVLTPAEIAASGARTDLCWGVPGAWCKVPSAGELRARIVELETLLREVYESQPAACTGGRAPCGRCLWCRVRAALDGAPAPAPARPVVQCRRCRKWHIHPAPGETRMVCAAVHAPGDCCHYGEREIEAPAPVAAPGE